MNIRAAVIGSIVSIVIVFVIVVATRPSEYRVERSLEIGAPSDRVFEALGDLHRFVDVLVLFGEPLDPKLPKSFGGSASGAGQSVSWAEDGHAGTMTIEESRPGEKLLVRLDFVKPMKSTARHSIVLAGAPNGTAVTWSMSGHHNFIGKAFGLFVDMDGMLAADIDKSLARLQASAAPKPQ